MTTVGNVYGEALYDLAKEESLSKQILQELAVLQKSFSEEPAFLKLLSASNISKQERCDLLGEALGKKVHPYVLNFLKLLTEKGYARHFSSCCEAYRANYNTDNGIVPVTAVSAVALTDAQKEKLTQKLAKITGNTIELTNRVDPEVLGGIRLDYSGKRLDDTVQHRLASIRELLKNTVL